MNANSGVQVEPVTDSRTAISKQPKLLKPDVPVVSTETAAVLCMIPVTGVTVPDEGPLITINPENQTVDVVATSETDR
jgi:hypothetical protein